VVWGRCWEDGSAPAYWPWVQVMRTLWRSSDPDTALADMGSGAAYIAQLLPEIRLHGADLGAQPVASVLSAEQARFPLFDAAASFLMKTAARQPLLLILDDLHAADPPSLRLLQFLARDLRNARMVVIGTYRPVDVERQREHSTILGAVARDGHRIPLTGWSEVEVARFIEHALPLTAHAAPPELVGAVYRTTE